MKIHIALKKCFDLRLSSPLDSKRESAYVYIDIYYFPPVIQCIRTIPPLCVCMNNAWVYDGETHYSTTQALSEDSYLSGRNLYGIGIMDRCLLFWFGSISVGEDDDATLGCGSCSM
jgi:hypothetical protein